MNRELLAAALTGKWAIRREAIPALLAAIRADLQAPKAADERQAGPYERTASDRATGPVAVIRVIGGISHRDSYWSSYFGTTVERFKAQFRAALNDDGVTAILLDVDSPGGTVDGVPELATEIFKARGRKPIAAVSNTLMCSAAYWLAAQADEVYVSPSAETGSIGVWTLHEDVSAMLDQIGVKISLIFAGEHKVDGNPFKPLSEEARADIQKAVDDCHADFLAAVARGRGVSVADVRKSYGQGRTYSAKDAVKLGLADKIATLDEVFLKLTKTKAPGGLRAGTPSLGCTCGINCHCQDGNREWCDATCERCSPDCACQKRLSAASPAVLDGTVDEGAPPAPLRLRDGRPAEVPEPEPEAAVPDVAAVAAADADYAEAAIRIAEHL